MNKPVCPICGDPRVYSLWADPRPPEGCPYDESWQADGPVTIKNVTECSYQMRKAWQEATFRKLVPDAFDETGTIKPGRIGEVLTAFSAQYPAKAVVI